MLSVKVLSDTSQQASATQARVFRDMTTEQRLCLALEMSESLQKISLAGLRSRLPDLGKQDFTASSSASVTVMRCNREAGEFILAVG